MPRWHPLTRLILLELGFTEDREARPNGDMARGNWLLWPFRDHAEDADLLEQFPLTLEHRVRGVCLTLHEPPMLDLLRMLG